MGGGGAHVDVEERWGVTCHLHGLQGALQKYLTFPTYFSSPHHPPPPHAPLYINNDRSLMTNEKTNVYASE